MRIGDVEVMAMLDGDAALDMPITEAFPDAPPATLMGASYSGLVAAGGTWHLRVRAWLVRHPGGVLLVDTGVGPSSSPAMGWFPQPGRLHEALNSAGSSADQIDTVVISHVHDDHIGGTVSPGGSPAFPNARYVVQAADVAAQRASAKDSDEDLAIWDALLQPLLDAGALQEIDGDHVLTDLLSLEHAPGHTPGHQVLLIASKGDRLMIAADAWNHPSQFGHPEWASAMDAEPALAAQTRLELLADLRSNPRTLVAPTHLAEAFGTVLEGPGGDPDWAPHPT